MPRLGSSFASCAAFLASCTLGAEAVVKLKVYWEALCPTSQEWMLTKYKPMYESQDFQKMFHVEHYAYGNAKTSLLGTITCQHGSKECDANRMITCAQHKLDQKSATDFMFCAVGKLKNEFSVQASVVDCVADKAVSSNIINCYSGSEGATLQAAVAKATITHSYVPWVTDESGNQLKSAENNLQKYLCSTVEKPGDRPASCNFAVLMRGEMSKNPYSCDNDGVLDPHAGLFQNATSGKVLDIGRMTLMAAGIHGPLYAPPPPIAAEDHWREMEIKEAQAQKEHKQKHKGTSHDGEPHVADEEEKGKGQYSDSFTALVKLHDNGIDENTNPHGKSIH